MIRSTEPPAVNVKEPETNQEKGHLEETKPVQGAEKNFPEATFMNSHRERRAASMKQEQDMIKQEQENSNKLFWKN